MRFATNRTPFQQMVRTRANREWGQPAAVKAFRTLDAALAECRAVRKAWLDFAGWRGMVLWWIVVDVRDGRVYDPTRPITMEDIDDQGKPRHGRIF